MDKCRICLTSRKRTLINIFEKHDNVTFADIMCFIANVKVKKNDGITDQVCRSCRISLVNAYELKQLIERSDRALNSSSYVKRVKFNNISELKIEIELLGDFKYPIVKCEDVGDYFTTDVNEFQYKDTVIKKVKIEEDGKQKPVPVLEFLESIKEDSNDDFDYDQGSVMDIYGDQSDEDGTYIPPKRLLTSDKDIKKSIKKRPRTYRPKEKENVCCFKPVYLGDLKLVHGVPKRKKKEKKDRLKVQIESSVCPHCGLVVKSLEKHVLHVHSEERNFKCHLCSKAFVTPHQLAAHVKRHTAPKNIKCDHCTATFNDKYLLKSHQLTHSSERKYVCDICSKDFKRLNALRRHKLMHSSASKNVMCELCNMSFFTKYGLRHHMRVHTGERPYNCEICSQPYSYKHDFNRHCLKKHGVFFKRRSVYVMNEEVLKQERILMRDLMLRVNGVIKDDKPLNPFEGPQATQAFEQTIKALQNRQIPIDF